jgi:SOS-response transcriptional repressor LexA
MPQNEYSVTAKQLEVLLAWHDMSCELGAQPTHAEIALQLGFKSPNSVYEHIAALTKKGVFNKTKMQVRRRELSEGGKKLIAKHRGLSVSNSNQENIIVEADILIDPTCSYWLREQILLERDPIDMLNDIDTLIAVIKNRIYKE